MLAAKPPPTRSSPRFSVMVKPRGHDQCARCCGSVHALKTSARGAAKVRRIVSSRPATLFPAFASTSFLLSLQFFLLLQSAEVGVEAIKALLPVAAIAL